MYNNSNIFTLICAILADSMQSYIKGGTVDALIAEATVYRDSEFVQTIVFTHSTFTTTDDILKKCTKRYFHSLVRVDF